MPELTANNLKNNLKNKQVTNGEALLTNGSLTNRRNIKISVIVPALNEEKLITNTLLCFKKDIRLKNNIELIVSDGGSRDRTLAIANELSDIVVEHKEKRRQTIAEGRNKGAERATGDILVFINADTVPCNPDKFIFSIISSAEKMMRNNGDVAIACPVEIAPSERRFSDKIFHSFFNRYVRVLNFCGFGMGRGECQIVKKDMFKKVGGYINEMAAGEDFNLYQRLSRLGKIGYHRELKVFESPRRFRRYGYWKVLLEWTLNGLAVMLIGRSVSKEWEEIR